MDQHEEQEMEDRSEEEEYKAAAEEERSSDEESTAASSLFVHPCSLLQCLVRACACCLGMQDSFGGMKPSAAAPAHTDSSREEAGEADNKTSDTGFYMQEVITRVWAVRRPKPPPPDKPREGSGGNGGHHH